MLRNIKSPSNYGQSVVIGSVLMFGILIVAFSIYQASVIPQQNAEVEYQHYTEFRSDMIAFDTTVDQTKSLNTASTTMTVSKSYPTRLIAVNPPPFRTRISIGDNNPTTISNFSVDSSGNEVDYWNQQGQLSIPNSTVTATPNYNLYQNSNPLLYENQVTYIETEDLEPVLLSSESPVDNQTIDLQGYTGELSPVSSAQQQITVKQVSGSRDVLYISGDGSGDPIQIQMNTQIPEITWRKILDVSNNPNIESVDYDQSSDTLTIELDPSQTYIVEAYLSATNPSDSIESASQPTYIQTVSSDTVASGENIPLSVHDQLGNTVSGAVVTVSDDPQNCITFNEKRTNTNGEVSFTCQTNQNTTVTFQINNGNESYETVTVNVSANNGNNNTGGNANVTSNITSMTATQAGGGPPQNRPYDIDVDWEITTQSGSVQDGTLTLRDSSGNVVDQRNLNPDSNGDSGQETFRVTGTGNTYEATLVATDQKGNTSEDTQTVTT